MPTGLSVPPFRRSTETVLARVITHMLAHTEKEGLSRDALLRVAGLDTVSCKPMWRFCQNRSR
jgi:hypothetical protein